MHVSSLAVCRRVILIIWLILYAYFYFVNSLLTDIQNVDNITITIMKVKMVSRLLDIRCRRTRASRANSGIQRISTVCAEKHVIFLPKTDKSVASFDRGKSL